MARCGRCGKESPLISKAIGFCLDCIRENFEEVWPSIQRRHHQSRGEFQLPSEPPREPSGIACNLCVNECRIPEGGRGYCGLRTNKNGRLVGVSSKEGNLSWYYDSLPTNCVADWVCPGGTEAGYPDYSYSRGPEYGYKNLAVFYQACSFNCLFCQNWHYREEVFTSKRATASQLVEAVDDRTACICYFGGDPAPQLTHSIEASRLALERRKGKILRICWETNGTMNPIYLDQMAELSLKSGGCIKFDLKAWSEEVNLALCGVSNKRTLENFKYLAKRAKERPDPPLLVASTLLVPGYVDREEVRKIAVFIASLDPNIPYALLAFYPQFYMNDLPTTSRDHAFECKQIAEKEGLVNLRIGNLHLLGDRY